MPTPINPTIGRLWVHALRSGRYAQVKGVLQRDGEGHCCLGVLCDLVEPLSWGQPDSGGVIHHRCFAGTPAPAVLERVGMRLGDASHLAFMNDEGKTFTEIADYIETELMGGDTTNGH